MAAVAVLKIVFCAAVAGALAAPDCGSVGDCGAAGDLMEEGGIQLLQRKAYKKTSMPRAGLPEKIEAEVTGSGDAVLQAADMAEQALEQEHEVARSWLRSVFEGRLPPATRDEVVAKFRRVAAAKVNASASDIEEVFHIHDKNKDGRLAPAELQALFEPALEKESESYTEQGGEDQGNETPDVIAPTQAAKKSLAKQGTGGAWQDYSCCDDFYARRYSEPRYFKPRVMFNGGFTVKGCAMISFILPGSSCRQYFYSNAVGNGFGMCRCFPDGLSYWPSGPAWTWYVSSSSNYIYSYSR